MKTAIESKFKFNNPRVVELSFKVNSAFDDSKYNGYGIQYETRISNREAESAEVSLAVSLGVDEETVPFLLKAMVKADFKWDSSLLNDETVDSLLNRNAKVLLLSYLRPFIAHMTVDAGFSPFVLPFYDFTEEK